MELKLLTWNVNGLRACSEKFGGVERMLRHLDAGAVLGTWQRSDAHMIQHACVAPACPADIVCVQEHKLRKQDVDSDMALVPGWCECLHIVTYCSIACQRGHTLPSVPREYTNVTSAGKAFLQVRAGPQVTAVWPPFVAAP
jgi:exonuclease III